LEEQKEIFGPDHPQNMGNPALSYSDSRHHPWIVEFEEQALEKRRELVESEPTRDTLPSQIMHGPPQPSKSPLIGEKRGLKKMQLSHRTRGNPTSQVAIAHFTHARLVTLVALNMERDTIPSTICE
jgi:hypothetical protein